MKKEEAMDLSVDFDRLKKDILELACFGSDPQGGISRPSFSPADLEARAWLKCRIEDAGLAYRCDGAGNIFGRLDGEGKTIMSGSHIDTVINGGRFDGSIGVLTALECCRRIKEEGFAHRRPLEMASFTDEEGNLVGDFLGSRAFLGHLDRKLLEEGKTPFGLFFRDVLAETEFTIDGILEAHLSRPELEAFLEIHIEQGSVLETDDRTIGIVDRIAGKNYWLCRFSGRAGHAGTTPFELRQDAFLGLADFALKSTHYVATEHYGSMLTVGRVFTHPGVFSIVPGRTDFTLDFRSTSVEALRDMEKQLPRMAEDIAVTRGLRFTMSPVDRTEPVVIPSRITDLLEEECGALGYACMRMPSGAGHDAQLLTERTDAGMIFIPCEDGISHSPEENIDWDDLEKGANLLLRAMLRLANE